MVVYRGKRKLKDLIKFLDKEMEKAKKERVVVKYFPHCSVQHNCSVSVCLNVCASGSCFLALLKINFFLLCLQEDEDRRKYIEDMKAEEAKKANKTKDEL